MNGYPGGSYVNGDFDPSEGADDMMNMLDADGNLSMSGMIGGESLDDIVSQNSKVMRRRSMPVQYGSTSPNLEGGDLRRVSMMDFPGTSAAPMSNFRFDFTTAPPADGMINSAGPFSTSNHREEVRPESLNPLDLNTQIANQTSIFGPLGGSNSAFNSPMQPDGTLDMDMTSPYMAGDMPLAMDQAMNLADSGLSHMITSDGMQPVFPGSGYASPMVASPIQQDFTTTIQAQPQDTGSNAGTVTHDHMSGTESKRPTPTSRTSSQSQSTQLQNSTPISNAANQSGGINFGPDLPPHLQQGKTIGPQAGFMWPAPPGGFPSTMTGRPHMETQFKNIYSSTGFDMLTVLMKVATRPNPEISIGAVDLSCAFVVCDAEKDDNPIVYCSENFERLTGYTRHMILGRNCRFLQSPDGRVEAGTKRKYVDDESVYYLKTMISTRKEAQISLINYRRGGQPFMNLLTMIPLTWDSDKVKFIVGFQVDLVEQPSSVTNKNPGESKLLDSRGLNFLSDLRKDGSYLINYQRGIAIPPYVAHAPEISAQIDLGGNQSVQRDDVSALLLTYGTADSEISKRMWDRVLLENTDDVIHVMSLKGLFMYLSPSARRVLEYEPSELIGTALSSICHPSDIVPVTRELKDSAGGNSINIVYRIRRKHSGYMWFDCYGALHIEQGKGRKCIIMVGRERPVFALLKQDIQANGGIGDNEVWSKLSTSGMFLFVSSNVRALLDRQPDEMIGVSIQSLMRQETKVEFARILELARVGKKASVKHEMINKRGQSLQAFTTIYPGDAVEGQKPTFLVAQTRMLRFSRGANSTARSHLLSKTKSITDDQMRSNASSTSMGMIPGSMTPSSGISGAQFMNTEGSAVTYAGQNGLAIARQDALVASDENMFDELKTTRSTSWQYELRQMERTNKVLAEEVHSLQQAKKKRKRRKGAGNIQKDCANCHTRTTPEWRRGPSGQRDLCNSCGLRWAKQVCENTILWNERRVGVDVTVADSASIGFSVSDCEFNRCAKT